MLLNEKYLWLKQILSKHDSLLVAFSGGADSALLLKVACEVLGQKAAGCTAVSPTFSQHEREATRQVAEEIGARHFFIEYDELSIPGYAANLENRCYLCKTELFSHLRRLALEKGFQSIGYGANQDDLKEYRPGMKAAGEMNICAPLLEAGFTKEDVRGLSKRVGLSTWNKPALACLSSRIPYGMEISHERLRQVEQAESVLRNLEFIQFRVRHHETIARIEISGNELSRLLEPGIRDKMVKEIKKAGFKFVALDLEGYRAGSVSGQS